MKKKIVAAVLAGCVSFGVSAQVEIQWWHSMTANNNDWVNDLAKDFNASQAKYKIMPVYKGTYEEAMTAAGIDGKVCGWIIDKMISNKQRWFEVLDVSFLSDILKEKYKSLIEERLSRLK